MNKVSSLVWIDLEMTGLNPDKDAILEIATIITDNELNIIAKGPHIIIHHDPQTLEIIDDWPKEVHTKSGLLKQVAESTITTIDAYNQTLDFIKKHCKENESLLAGNSVWQDRAFLKRYMSGIVSYLHYRIIDVSTIKELVHRWYPNNPHIEFEKKDTHRALEDIEESIEELKYYKKHFFI